MSLAEHNYGPKCRLTPVSPPQDADKEECAPPIRAQFFYSSVIPIDDPLASGAIVGAADTKAAKGKLRLFSPGDNNALERAWYGLASEADQRAHRNALRDQNPSPDPAGVTANKRSLLVRYLALKHRDKHASFKPQDLASPTMQQPWSSTSAPTCCDELFLDTANVFRKTFCSLTRERDTSLVVENVVQDVMKELRRLRSVSERRSTTDLVAPSPQLRPVNSSGARPESRPAGASEGLHSQKGTAKSIDIGQGTRARSLSQITSQSSTPQTPVSSSIPTRPPQADDGISGMPFVRVGSPDSGAPPYGSFHRFDEPSQDTGELEGGYLDDIVSGDDHGISIDDAKKIEMQRETEYGKESVDVPVGVFRLHMVSLPVLQMKPIYWSPVNDLAVVTRATWFYRDTMMPIPPETANQLEAGYQELRPYSETWSDELRCAVEIGSVGEEKVSHRLWPKGGPAEVSCAQYAISGDQYCAAHCFRGEAASEGSVEPLQVQPSTSPSLSPPFSSYHVIYKNATEAFLLKPSLAPSAYYGRKPVFRITKGLTVGIPVVRGFDRAAWERIYDKNSNKTNAKSAAPTSPVADQARERAGQGVCPACKKTKEKGQVTDLVLVAHGIGQKLSERVESFHFTHAINAFRREMNLELGKPAVKEVLRDGQNGIMVLPVNWRHTLSFEDGGPMSAEDKSASRQDGGPMSAEAKTASRQDGFGLKDIQPNTIPVVRSLISDVMLDIPFYMSHHKGKMIQALVSEANRVYRLWCRNNPGFSCTGRVHLIAHSLGSAMALEVLSRQPTIAPKLDLSVKTPTTDHFEFDTKNLFLLGSPAGFFLLLERGVLVPRRGRRKPGADAGDTMAKDVVDDVGAFGCLAVDNIYNVLAKEDPIAYLLNGTIDPTYAASLKTAYVPSTAVSLFQSMGNAVRGVMPGMSGAETETGAGALAKPPTVRLPSQLELEVHDFSREEILEKKAYLLNDNGQIDWYLRSGGGPLEIQYVNMLSAHTSYWTNQDLIRMLCMEIGREPGREHTLPAMRAVKVLKRNYMTGGL